MVGERILDKIDREPFWRRVADKMDEPAHELRNTPGRAIRGAAPKFEERNFGDGKGIGLLEAAIAVIIEDTVGVPFGADADVSTSEVMEDGILYTVNVNAPTQNMAEARAMIDAGTGFTSILADKIDVNNVELRKTRVGRDTFEIDVFIGGR